MLNLELMEDTIMRSGLKKSYVAMQIGLTPSKLSMVLSGRRKLSADSYAAFCNLFGKSAKEFLK